MLNTVDVSLGTDCISDWCLIYKKAFKWYLKKRERRKMLSTVIFYNGVLRTECQVIGNYGNIINTNFSASLAKPKQYI